MNDEGNPKIVQIVKTGIKLVEEIRDLNNEEIKMLLNAIKKEKEKSKKYERDFYLREKKRKRIYFNLLSVIDLCDKNLYRKEKIK